MVYQVSARVGIDYERDLFLPGSDAVECGSLTNVLQTPVRAAEFKSAYGPKYVTKHPDHISLP